MSVGGSFADGSLSLPTPGTSSVRFYVGRMY